MKNVGIRFRDGTEVAYYRSKKIQSGTDDKLRVLGEYMPGIMPEIIAELAITDVKELFEAELEEGVLV